MTRWLAALTLGLSALVAHAQQGAPCLHPRTEQALPQVLGPSFVRVSTHSFEATAPGQGCSVRYQHPSGMWADVYIYRGGHGVVQEVARDPRLMQEFQQVFAGINHMWSQEQRKGKLLDIEGRYETRGKAGAEVMVGSANIEPESGAPTLRTHVQLWSGGGSIWKLRVTFNKSDQAVSDPAVQALGEALVDLSREAVQ
ncbi:MAG: hypothetical protein EOP35_20175 [Rubrivivax sp.]|nr:MAG: hypothetical protein EOP35_20175 [Rubrivivax sp.]